MTFRIKDHKWLYEKKVKFRKFKFVIKNIFYILSFRSNIIILLSFIRTSLQNIQSDENYIKKIYKGFKTNHADWFAYKINLIKFYINSSVLKNKLILEIGSFEGKSTIFFLNLFKNSKIFCVDTWQGSNEYKYKITCKNSIEKNFDINIKKFKKRVIKNKMKSDSFFKKKKNLFFDFIFIDGFHRSDQVFRDSINSFRVLRQNGYILFDDYLYKFYKNQKLNPIYGINRFLKKFKKEIKIIFCNEQLLVKKISS